MDVCISAIYLYLNNHRFIIRLCGQLISSLCCFAGGGTGYVCEALQGGGVPDGAEAL